MLRFMENARLIFVMIIVVFSICHKICAQQKIYNFRTFTVDEGLPSNKVRSIAVDQNGIIWYSSDMGLGYFDGKNFHDIRTKIGKSNLSTDFGRIAIDQRQNIWISTYDQGLLHYNRRKPPEEAFTRYSCKIPSTNLVKNELYTLMVSVSGLVYFGGQETGLQVLDPNTGEIDFKPLINTGSNPPISIYSLSEDVSGTIYIGTRYHGLVKYNPHTQQVENFDLYNSNENAVGDVLPIHDDLYVPYYNYGVLKVPKSLDGTHSVVFPVKRNVNFYDSFISALGYDKIADKLLVAHYGSAIYEINHRLKTVDTIPWGSIFSKEVSFPRVNQILGLENGDYWMATEEGLVYYSKEINDRQLLYKNSGPPILKIINAHSKYWYYDGDSFGQLSKGEGFTKYPMADLSGVQVSEIHTFDDKFFFSTYDRGVYVFDIKDKAFTPLPIDGPQHGFRVADCNSIVLDTIAEGRVLWIGSWNSGLYRYNIKKEEIQLFGTESGLPNRKIITLGKDADKKLWIGMDGFGLVRLIDKDKMQFKHIAHKQQDSSPVSSSVFAFKLLDNGTFWFSSSNIGIGQMKTRSDTTIITRFKDVNKHPWAYGRKMVEDKHGRIWIKSSKGVMVFDQKSAKLFQLRYARGMYPGPEFKVLDFCLDGDQVIWATDRGIITNNIQNISLARHLGKSPQVSLFKILNKEANHLLLTKNVRLRPSENNLSFVLSCPEAVNNPDIIYRYRMDGVDSDWIIASDDQHAVYTNLSGGDYCFKVQVGDIYGNWSDRIWSKNLYIDTPWYKTELFFAFCTVFFLGSLFFVFYHRINQQKKINLLQSNFNKTLQQRLNVEITKVQEQAISIEKAKREKSEIDFRKRLYESELKAIRAQMNPHFIFNILNSIEACVVENDTTNASILIHKFSRLSRIVLENSLSPLASLTSEIQLVELYLQLEQTRFQDSFIYEISVDSGIDLEHVLIPSMLIQPIVENAVHHGIRNLTERRGMILINISSVDKSIKIEVVDNGVGLLEGPKKTSYHINKMSFGLQGIEERIKIINQNMITPVSSIIIEDIRNTTPYSTIVSITLPLFPKFRQ